MKIGVEFKNLQSLTADRYYVEHCLKYIYCYLLTMCHDMEIKPVYEPIVKNEETWINSQEKGEKMILIHRITAEIDEKHFDYIKRNINNDLRNHLGEELMVYEIK